MHVIILVVTLFFADPKLPPVTASILAPSAEACEAGANALAVKFKTEGYQGHPVADTEFGCFDVVNRATKPA